MNISPTSAVVAALQAAVADLMARDLNMLGEIVGKSSAVTPSTASPTAPASAPSSTPAAIAPPSPPAVPPPSTVAQAVTVARADAAGRQAGLAPLMADLAQVAQSPALPVPLRAAIGQVLALQTPLSGPLSAQVVARAVAQSGLFLEAHLSAANGVAAQGGPTRPDLKAALLTLQQALAVPAAEEAAPPAQPRAAVAVPTASPTPSQASPTARTATPPAAQSATAQSQSAPSQSGPPQSASRQSASPQSAAVPQPTPPPPAAPSAPDLKAAVQTLQQALAAPAQETAALPAPLKAALAQVLAPPPLVPGAPPAQTFAKAAAQLATLLEAYLAAPQEETTPEVRAALQTLQQALAAPEPDKPTLPPRAAGPSPPARDGATTAQAAARSSLPEHADAQTIAQVLSRGVDQALARQTLHQLASLPDGPNQAWMFELPVATPGGAAVAQFQIDHNGGSAAGGEGDAGWRVRFSIDIEPLGPVHVHLNAGGERAAVTVWAERPDGLTRLRSLGGELARALPADVRFQGGSPRKAAPRPGRFVDQTS